MDQLAVSMLTDQQMRFRPSIGQRHHQLLTVPKRDDDPLAFAIQLIHLLPTLGPQPQG
jgi:hypothetical protein